MSFFAEVFGPLLDRIEAAKRGPVPPPEPDVWPPENVDLRPTTADEAVRRALEWVGRPSTYKLGGGAHVDLPHPFWRGSCDCSGFTGHVTGHNRIQRLGGKRVSFYTDNVVRDVWEHRSAWSMRGRIVGRGPRRLYVDADDVRPGDLVVRKGYYVAGRRVKIGHIGIIVDVKDGFARGLSAKGLEWWRFLDVVHCTPNRGRANSVVKTNARTFRKRSYIVRPRWYRPSATEPRITV